MKKLVFLLLLSGCVSDYQPALQAPPKDTARYESDRQLCFADVKKRAQAAIDDYQSSGKWIMGGLGAAGGVAVALTADKDKDYSKDGRTMMDECMTSKGYSVIKQSHCC